jgi:branched-chain amino acid aminotransferase
MSDFINFNGKLISADTPVIGANSRGLRFGDGLFETIKYKNNEFQLLEEHLERLWTGLKKLHFELPALFTRQFLTDELTKLVNKKNHTCARVRLTILRGNGGLYDAENHQPNFIIQTWELANDFGKLNSNGLQLCIYKDAFKPCDAFSNLKHNNFLPYVMGALHAKQVHCNDAVILNQYGRIADSTIANIFMLKNNIIYTPSLEEGCVAGTMRQFLLKNLPSSGHQVLEKQITEEELAAADEIFLSNAMTPVKWVAGLGRHSFSNEQVLSVYNKMAQTFPQIFC